MHSNSVIFVVLCSLLDAAINSSLVFYVFAVKGKVRYTVIRTKPLQLWPTKFVALMVVKQNDQ